MFLRQSTSQLVRFGPFLDITDGVTEEVALTLTQAEMRLSKDGAAFAQKNAAGNATHDSDGWYSTTLNATDTDTAGELLMNVQQPANTLPVWVRWFVVEEAVYDAFYAAAAVGIPDIPANWLTAAGINAGAITNAKFAAGAIDDNAIAANAITAAKIATAALTAIKFGAGAIDAAALATDAVNEIRDAITGGAFALDTDASGRIRIVDGTGVGEIDTVAGLVQLSFSQTLPGSPTADTVGDALKQATLEEVPKKNVAFNDLPFFMVDSTDHVTPETGLSPTGQRSLDGGAFGAITGTIFEVANGIYRLDASIADMNADLIVFRFSDAAADDSFVVVKTVA